ncbi:MAG: sulfate reduction electron transfer complex DsrMKJOP subunit DsrJ [Proteobacteria bacterium]|nr:sulfate reduction electron transfer complex DsrMKJOP subunit DsrJ [Pseudomonadota bacterium]MBU4297971.1 sulfate reduction electron transfer complex DsrMKJOP subunit DsrJ [Pseudomonadota bacterium]MCG2749531.1 sulfate reduction electron transfer complex DsrMKJOP subunit DsrJ [Desulfobulbaceae bacterium]
MYNKGTIIPGLIIFVGLMLFAVLWDGGGKVEAPKPEKPVGYKECVKPLQYMKESHMELLNVWRDEVLREGKREPIEVGGVMYEKSLQNGCMHCHTSKKKFCDTCHEYASVYPYCWDCHVAPQEDVALKEAR